MKKKECVAKYRSIIEDKISSYVLIVLYSAWSTLYFILSRYGPEIKYDKNTFTSECRSWRGAYIKDFEEVLLEEGTQSSGLVSG